MINIIKITKTQTQFCFKLKYYEWITFFFVAGANRK
jgi:hypothetical protein